MKYSNLLSNKVTSDSNIIGRDRYLNSAVLVPIVSFNGVEYLLFQKRSKHVRQPGEVSFPGGHYEKSKDKDYLSTAIRESCEELGIKEDKITIIGKLGTLIAPMGVIVEAFIGKLFINSLDDLKLDNSEVEKIFIVPIDFFLQTQPQEYITRLELHPTIVDENGKVIDLLPVKNLGLPDRYASPWTKGKHRVLVYTNTEEIIWGITAELVFELINQIKRNIDEKL